MIILKKDEAIEIEKFRKRRKSFNNNLSVANVHNVASIYPIMYKRIFKTDSLESSLFCSNSPMYGDQSEEEVERYEKALSVGYEVEEAE